MKFIYLLMAWDIEYTDEFGEWWNTLSEQEHDEIFRVVGVLEIQGPMLQKPYSKKIESSRHYPHMKELRTKVEGVNHLRIFYAFDPRRAAILLIGGNKTGRWSEFYDEYIPIADGLYDDHLKEIKNQ